MIEKDEIFDGIIGGGRLSKDKVREGISEPEELIVKSELDRRMARLLSLHPQVPIRFRNNDLASLDEKTKEALLQDIYDSLGIIPLRNE